MAPSGQNRPQDGGRGRGRGRDRRDTGGRGGPGRGSNPGRGDSGMGGAQPAPTRGQPPPGEIPDAIDGGFVFVAKERLTKEARDKRMIGIGADGAWIMEDYIKSTNTAVFICTVNDTDQDHRVMLDVFRPVHRKGQLDVFNADMPSLDPHAFASSQQGMPAQVGIKPWLMGSDAKTRRSPTQGASRYLLGHFFNRYLTNPLTSKLRRLGKDEVPVVLDADEARELAWGLVQATTFVANRSPATGAAPGEVAVRVRQRDPGESNKAAAAAGTITVVRDGRMVRIPVRSIEPKQLSQEKATTDLDIVLDTKQGTAERVAALKAIGAACQGAGGPDMFLDSFSKTHPESLTNFYDLAMGLTGLHDDLVDEVRTLAPAVLGTAACALIRGFAAHLAEHGLVFNPRTEKLSVPTPAGLKNGTVHGRVSKPFGRYVEEDYTPARMVVWGTTDRRVREGEIPGDVIITGEDFDMHFFDVIIAGIERRLSGVQGTPPYPFEITQKEFYIEAACACLAPLMDAIVDAQAAVDADGDDASIVRHSNMLHILWERIPRLLKSCVSMMRDPLVYNDLMLPLFRLFSILTRPLTIKSLFLDDVAAKWMAEGSVLAGDVSKTFPSMRINVATKEFDLPWRETYAVKFEDFVDAIIPWACSTRCNMCWTTKQLRDQANELLSKFKFKWSGLLDGDRRAYQCNVLNRLKQYCIEPDVYRSSGNEINPLCASDCFRSCMGDIGETAWEEATSIAYDLMSHVVYLKAFKDSKKVTPDSPFWNIFLGSFNAVGALLDGLLNGSDGSAGKLAQLEKDIDHAYDGQKAKKTKDKWEFLQEHCFDFVHEFRRTFFWSAEGCQVSNQNLEPQVQASFKGMLACLRFHNVNFEDIFERPITVDVFVDVFESLRFAALSPIPGRAEVGKKAYLGAAKSSNDTFRYMVAYASGHLLQRDLKALKKTSKDRAKEPDVDALERVIMLDLDVHICLWRGSDGTESEVAVKKALCVISDRFPGNPGNKKGVLQAGAIEQILKSRPVLLDRFSILRWKMDLYVTAKFSYSDSNAEALLLPAMDPDTADAKPIAALRMLLEDKASAEVYLRESFKIFRVVCRLACTSKEAKVRMAATELLVDRAIVPVDSKSWASMRGIKYVYEHARNGIGDASKAVREKWAEALPTLALAATWREGECLHTPPSWLKHYAVAARRANFQSEDLKSILDALTSKDMTKVAPATIRKMIDRAAKVAPPPTRQDPVAASLTSVGGTLLNAAAADRAAMRGASETPPVQESAPAPSDLDSDMDTALLDHISTQDDAAMWWAVQEAARQCISARLRTHYGNASETLTFIERSLGEVRRNQTPTVAGARNVSRTDAQSMTATWLLLEFVDALERQMYNAYEGTLSLPPPGKSAASFFRRNKHICVDWLRRIKEASLGAAKSCGNVAMGANIALSRVQAAIKAQERRVDKAARRRAEAPARILELKSAVSDANARLTQAHKRHGLGAARLERARQTVSERMNANKSKQEIDKAKEKVDELKDEVKDAKEEVSVAYRDKNEAQEKLKDLERKSAGNDTDSEKDAAALVFRAIGDAASLLVSFGEPDLLIGLADWCEPRLRPAGADVWLPPSSDDAFTTSTEGVLDWVRAAALEAGGRHEQAAEKYRHMLETPEKIGPASARAAAKRLTHAYASVCDWDGLEEWRKDLRKIQRDVGKTGSIELASALNDVGAKPELLGAWANFDEGQFDKRISPLAISEKHATSPSAAVDVLNHATQRLLEELLVPVYPEGAGESPDKSERIVEARKQLQTAMKRMQEPLRLSNLMGSPAVTQALHIELAAADAVYGAVNEKYCRVFGAVRGSYDVSTLTPWIKLCRVLNALSIKEKIGAWPQIHWPQVAFESLTLSAELVAELTRCAGRLGNFKVFRKIFKRVGQLSELDLESDCVQFGQFVQQFRKKLDFIESDAEGTRTSKDEQYVSICKQYQSAFNALVLPRQWGGGAVVADPTDKAYLVPLVTDSIQEMSRTVKSLADDLSGDDLYGRDGLFGIELIRMVYTFEEHMPADMQKRVEPTYGELLHAYSQFEFSLDYARFLDDFHRREEDDPKRRTRRDKDPISAAGIEDIDGVCGEPTPLNPGADVKEVTYLLEAAHAYARFLIQCGENGEAGSFSRSQTRLPGSKPMPGEGGGDLNLYHAKVRLLNFANSQQIGESDGMKEILGSIPTAYWRQCIPELITMLHSDIEPVRDNVTDLLTRMAKEHPRALSYAIAVAAAAADDEADAAGEGFEVGGFRSNPEALAAVRERFASASRALEAIGKVKSALSATDPRLFADVTLVVSELGRLAVLHDEELLTSLQDLHGDVTSRIASVSESSEPIEDVMRPAVAELDRLVRDALSGAGFVTPHVKSFAKKYREGLLDAVNEFKGSVASDPSNGWRAVKEQMVQLARGLQRKRELRLKNLSPSLAKLESRPGGFAAPMPGDVGGDVDSILVDIVSVGSDVTVLPTKSRPKRITLLGSDGTRRVFLLKGNEDLRLDARLMRFGSVVNAALLSDPESRKRSLEYSTYSVTPLAGNSGLIQWVEKATPMSAIFAGWQRRTRAAAALPKVVPPPGSDPDPEWRPPEPPEAATTRPLDLFYNRVSAALRAAGVLATAKRRDWPQDVLHDTVQRMRAEVPQDYLHRELWCGAPTASAWLQKSVRHARSVATASVVGHLIGLGDRHLDNVLVNLTTGAVVHIDYNVSFDRGLTLPVPEVVPFRLTPAGVAALGPTETYGPFRCAAEATLVALRRLPARQALLGSLELLTRDPLMEWVDDGAAGQKGGKHTRRGDEAREHAALELAHGLASFAGKIQDASAALGPTEGSETDLGSSPGSSWSATFLLSGKFHEHLATLKTKVTKDGAAVIAAAEAAEKAETARLEARDALAASARASDAEEFSASGVSAASLNLRDAIDSLASAATDARQWSDRHRRALDRLAPDSGELVRLKHKTTTTEDTGGAPMLRAAPMAASLALSPELQSAAGAIDGEGARLLAARDEAVDRATSSLERYREWVVANLPSSYPESDRRAVWANTLEEAAKVRVEAPGEAIERLGELIDAARVTDSDGKRAWTKYCAATGAWHARESTELPALRAQAKAAADTYTKYARSGTREYPGHWETTVECMYAEMMYTDGEGPTLGFLEHYIGCPPVRDERRAEVQTVDSLPDELDSPPDESNELFAPSSNFFGDMEGDGEELGGLGDEDDDLLEREISNLRVEDDLDIEELMNDDDVSPSPEPRVADDESADDDTEGRFMAMPRREKSAVMAAAMYSVFNSDEYDEKADSLTRFLPPKTFVDLAMDSAMLPHKVMRYILPIALDPRAVDPMRSMRIVEAAQVSQVLDRRAHDLRERQWRDSGVTDVEVFWREGEALAAELKAHVESLAQDMPALTEALLAHVCCDTVLRPNTDPEYAGCWIHPVYAVKAVSKLVTRILAACAANVSGDLREENIVEGEHEVGGKLEDVAATVIKEAEEAADIINVNVVEHTLENTFSGVAPTGGQNSEPRLEGATKGKDVRTMLDAAARAVYAVRRSAAEAELADRERRHATSSGAISRCEWLLESRLEQGSDGAWGFETEPTASRRWRTQHLDHVATAAAELASADIAVRSWAQRAGAVERSFVEYFRPWADRDRMETLARSLEDRSRALKDSEQRAATCRQLCEGVESFERSREPEREAAAAETLLPEGFLDFSFDAGLDDDEQPDPIRAAGGIAKNPFKKKGKKPVNVTEVQTQRSKRSNAEVAGGFEKTYESAVTDVILACEEVLQTAMAPAGPKAEAAAAARAEASEKAEKARELERIVDEKRRAIVDDIDVMAFIWHDGVHGDLSFPGSTFHPTAKMEPKSTPWYLRELENVATDLRNALCTPGTPVARFIEETRKHLDGLNALFPKVPTDLAEAIDIDDAEMCADEASYLLKEFEEKVERCIDMAIQAMDYSYQALTEAQHSREHGFTYSEEFSSAIRWFANATADLADLADLATADPADLNLSSTAKLLRAVLDNAQNLSRRASIEIKEHTGLGLTAAPPPDDDTEPPRRVEQPADSSDDEDGASSATIAAAATVRRRGSAQVTRWRGGRHPTAVRLISVVAAKLDGRPKLVELLRIAAKATPAPKVPYDIYYADTFGTMLPRSPAAAKGETPLTAKQDVDRLIAEATDAHRLASMYEGWCPWL